MTRSGTPDPPADRPPSLTGTIKPEQPPVFALLDNIRSAWNVGAMFRTADAANLAGLFLCGITATPPRPDLEKTALGATVTVPWDYWGDAAAAVRHLKLQGIRIVVLEQVEAAVPFDRFAFPFPLCFVVGNEVDGVNPDVVSLADAAVEIPMFGAKQSLNVAVSFGIMAYEILRSWSTGRT